jgi:inner membrane protein COX18
MPVLSRLGPHLGSTRPQLSRLSSLNLCPQISNESLALTPNNAAASLNNGLPGSRRNFSLAQSIDAAVSEAAQLMTSLHAATGTPWYITIPLAALAVNICIRLPVTIYTRTLEQKRAPLSPLIIAWQSKHIRDSAHENPVSQPSELRQIAEKRLAKTRRRIFRDHGLQQWKVYYLGPLSALPFFLTTIQGVRRLCGAEGGILGMFTNPLPVFRAWMSGTEGVVGETTSAATASSADGTMLSTDLAPVDIQPVTATASAATHAPLGADLLGYDPSLSTGGCLWFPDLTVADPLHVLPIMLSGVVLWVVLPKNMKNVRALLDTGRGVTQSWQIRLQRALVVMALVMGPLTWQLPAAMHLYWISSMLMANTMGEIVRWKMPLPKQTIQPARGREIHIIYPPPPPSGKTP